MVVYSWRKKQSIWIDEDPSGHQSVPKKTISNGVCQRKSVIPAPYINMTSDSSQTQWLDILTLQQSIFQPRELTWLAQAEKSQFV